MKENLNIIDLISEKHIVLRKEVEEKWTESEQEPISHTEQFLLVKINMGEKTLAEIARQANISRQAMFKCAKKLETREYLKFTVSEGSKRIELTEKGIDYCKKNEELKDKLEKKISAVLGSEQLDLLKELLNKNWIE